MRCHGSTRINKYEFIGSETSYKLQAAGGRIWKEAVTDEPQRWCKPLQQETPTINRGCFIKPNLLILVELLAQRIQSLAPSSVQQATAKISYSLRKARASTHAPSTSKNFLGMQCLRCHPLADAGVCHRLSRRGTPSPVRGPSTPVLHVCAAIVGFTPCCPHLEAAIGTNASGRVVAAHACVV